jgi:hypothetical protein
MTRFVLATIIIVLACQLVFAQQTNPVDRKVANPMTDTPNVNPLNTDQPVQRRPAAQNGVTGTGSDQIAVEATKQSGEGPENARIVHYEGNVDIRIGTYRLQADKVTVYEAEIRRIRHASPVRAVSGTIAPRPDTSSTQPVSQTKRRTARASISLPIEWTRSVSTR